MCCSSCSRQTETGKCLYYIGDIMVLSAERQTCDQEVMGLNLSWAHSVNILGKFLTPMCLWHQAVQAGTGLTAVTPEGWEGNCRPGGKYHQVHDCMLPPAGWPLSSIPQHSTYKCGTTVTFFYILFESMAKGKEKNQYEIINKCLTI